MKNSAENLKRKNGINFGNNMTRWRLAKIKAYMWLRLHLPHVAGYIEI